MANTFTLISTTTVGAGGAAAIEFTSIPQTFTDLQIVYSLRTDETPAYQDAVLSINGTNLNQRLLYANSATPGSTSTTADNYFSHPSAGATANTFSNGSVYIPNYTSTTTNKSVSSDNVGENNSGSSGAYVLGISAMLYPSNTAVTSVKATVRTGGKVFVQYSTASLYGILKGSGGATVS